MKCLQLPRCHSDKESICQCRRHKRCRFDSWGWKDPLEKGMATHSSIAAWKIPQTEELCELESMRLQSQTWQHTRTMSYMKCLYCTAQSAQSKSRAGIVNLLQEQSFWGLGNSFESFCYSMLNSGTGQNETAFTSRGVTEDKTYGRQK